MVHLMQKGPVAVLPRERTTSRSLLSVAPQAHPTCSLLNPPGPNDLSNPPPKSDLARNLSSLSLLSRRAAAPANPSRPQFASPARRRSSSPPPLVAPDPGRRPPLAQIDRVASPARPRTRRLPCSAPTAPRFLLGPHRARGSSAALLSPPSFPSHSHPLSSGLPPSHLLCSLLAPAFFLLTC